MYKVKLKSFEGPFDLLVYLIENAEMSIYDIKISEITNQYLAYLKEMEERDVALASEFMVLASSLIEIKSKMILPRATEDGQEIVGEDPRTELVARLLEYKRFKELSQMLEEREERSMNIFEKPQEDISQYLDNPDEYLSLDLKEFASAFSLFIQKKQRVEAVRKHYTRIERERASMEKRISYILQSVRAKIGQDFSFIGDQYRIEVAGEEMFIDLLFFNRELNSLVAVELKSGKFRTSYLGQLNTYLSALDTYIRKPHENPSIGIILCKEMNQTFVEFAVRDYNKPMGVATYRASKDMPERLRNALPNIEDLKKLL